MESLIQDIRYSFRLLWKQPGFTLVALLTLAAGIGANTAIYAVVDAVMLRPLPFAEPDRLMRVSLVVPPAEGRPGIEDMVWSYPKFQTLRHMQDVFDMVSTYRGDNFNLTGDGDAERLRGEVVSADYFALLGIKAAVGRVFAPEEDTLSGTFQVVLLSHGLWTRRYGSDPGVVGSSIQLDRVSHQVVGVLPAGFSGLSGRADLWVPTATLGAQQLSQRWSHSHEVVARLKDGVSPAQARNAVELLGSRIEEAHPDPIGRGMSAAARPLNDLRVDPGLRRALLVLFGAVAFVLLIACVNIANLLLARASGRRREIAVRLAVGADRRRLMRQLLTESLILALLGGAAALAVGRAGVHLLGTLQAGLGASIGFRFSGLTQWGLGSIALDTNALLFTLALALLTGLLFGLAPALQASRPQVMDELRSTGSAQAAPSARLLGARNLLVVAQLAMALMLLAGSGLMIRSLWGLVSTSSGADLERVFTMRVSLPLAQYNRQTAIRFYEELQQRIAALPGVRHVAAGNCYPLAGGCNGTVIWFRDRPQVPEGAEPLVGVHFVSADYFKTLSVPLLRGRMFQPGDREGSSKVVLINEEAARKFWPNEDPIGKPIAVGQGGFHDRAEIVGIVGNIRFDTLEQPPEPDVFIPVTQSPRLGLMLFARTQGDPLDLAEAARREVRALDPDLPTYDIRTLEDRASDATARARFSAVLLGIFAAMALGLASLGVYGVMSFLVNQRTREIGIRMALGADTGNILNWALRRGVLVTAAGLGLGVAAALAVSRVLGSLLYQVRPHDPATLVLTTLLLGAVALAASYIPARRATRVDPLTALRAE